MAGVGAAFCARGTYRCRSRGCGCLALCRHTGPGPMPHAARHAGHHGIAMEVRAADAIAAGLRDQGAHRRRPVCGAR